MGCVDWPGLGCMAQGPGWIHLTCRWGRGGSSREVQMLMQEEGERAVGWAQALMPLLFCLAFLKSPESLGACLIFPSASPLHSQFHHHPSLSFLCVFAPAVTFTWNVFALSVEIQHVL